MNTVKSVAESRHRSDAESDLLSCRADIDHMRIALNHIRLLSDQQAFRAEIRRFEMLIAQETETAENINTVLEYQIQNGL